MLNKNTPCWLAETCSNNKAKQNAAKFPSARTLFDVGCSSKQVDNTEKIAELKLAAHIACHSSIATVDHLGEIVKIISGKDISLHRTKCSALIKKALSPAVCDELLTDLKDQSYSLITDESTDTGMEQQLCVVVRYYSQLKNALWPLSLVSLLWNLVQLRAYLMQWYSFWTQINCKLKSILD